uniref:Uncharacterized protein n=1 Tax=Anguilla anguilla TaxID=7936 RepID=A0A0E9W531_ANGAN
MFTLQCNRDRINQHFNLHVIRSVTKGLMTHDHFSFVFSS